MSSPLDMATNNRGRSVIDLDRYEKDGFSLFGFHLTGVLDDIILVEYVDTNDGRDVVRNGIVLPAAHIQHLWRIGRALLVGPNCKTVKAGNYITFPNDKGIKASGITVKVDGELKRYGNAVFLNEPRIFGVCEPEAVEQSDGPVPAVVEEKLDRKFDVI